MRHSPCLLALVVALPLAGAVHAAPPASAASKAPPTVAAPADPMAFARGARAWAQTCSRCHAMRDPKEATARQWPVITTHMRLRAGLDGDQVRDITLFLQGAPAAQSTDPAAIYNGTCIACHGARAEGAFPGVPDLRKTGRLTKPTAALVSSIMDGMQTPGSPLAMPPKGGTPTLTAADAEALVAYLRTLAPAK